MNPNKELNISDISNLYITYNELFRISLENEDFKNIKTYFYKICKYYKIIYNKYESFISFKPDQAEHIKETLEALQEEFSAIEKKAKGFFEPDKTIDLENLSIDKFEELLFEDENLSNYKKIAYELKEKDAKTAAINYLKKYVKNNQDDYECYLEIAELYMDSGKYIEPIDYLKVYNSYCQTNPKSYTKLGFCYSIIDNNTNIDIGKQFFKKALELDPNYEEALRYMAVACVKDEDGNSIKYYKRLMQLNPTNNDKFSYGCEELRNENFEEGLKYWECMFTKVYNPVRIPEMAQPKWDGKTDLKNKTILLIWEQGYGDSIQFVRYLPKIKAKKIICCCPEVLKDLFKYSLIDVLKIKNIQFVNSFYPLNSMDYDYYLPFCSLMKAFDARINNIPSAKRYLKADEKMIKIYKEGFFNNDCLKIGIAWKGQKKGDNSRDIPIEIFHPLTEIKNAKVYSLQKDAENDFQNSVLGGVDMVDLGASFDNFMDTAAAIANLDVVVTSDCVVANLAGALGKKVLMILKPHADWRWFSNRSDSPWYSSMTIFRRESTEQGWEVPMSKAIEYIKEHYKTD